MQNPEFRVVESFPADIKGRLKTLGFWICSIEPLSVDQLLRKERQLPVAERVLANIDLIPEGDWRGELAQSGEVAVHPSRLVVAESAGLLFDRQEEFLFRHRVPAGMEGGVRGYRESTSTHLQMEGKYKEEHNGVKLHRMPDKYNPNLFVGIYAWTKDQQGRSGHIRVGGSYAGSHFFIQVWLDRRGDESTYLLPVLRPIERIEPAVA